MFVIPTALRGVSVLLAMAFVFTSAKAEDSSEQVPPSNVRGDTYNGGPKNYFEKGEAKSSEKKHDEKKSEKTEKIEKKDKENKADKPEKAEKKEEKKGDKKAYAAPGALPSADAGKHASPWGESALSLLNFPEDKQAAKPALSQYETDAKMRHAVACLCTSGWREAQDQLVRGGKSSVPYLIEGMSSSQNAFENGGHIKADTSRALRQRPLSEVCCEILRTIITTRSNYTGELPGSDAQAWQTWFSTQGSNVTFAN